MTGPGSSIFLFEGPQTVNAGDSGFKSPYVGSKRLFRYLHCGDFRACPKMVLHPEISRAKIDTCYLDTTYLNPKYCFPPQPQVIEACAQLARKTVLGLPDDAPPLRDVRPPVFDLIKAEHTAGMKREPGMGDSENRGAQGEDVKPDVKPNKDAIKYEPGLAEIEAEERGKAMMKGWLVNKEEAEAVKQEGDPGDGVKVKREEGEVLVSVEKSSVNDDKNKVQAPTADQAPKKKGRTLVVMGTYSIGKERIVKGKPRSRGPTVVLFN
jgi:DNA cross-link repair 1A protein